MIIGYMFYEYEDKYEGGGFTAKGAARVSVERSEAAALDLDHRNPQFQRSAFVILSSYLISDTPVIISVFHSFNYVLCPSQNFLLMILSSYLISDTPAIVIFVIYSQNTYRLI